MKHFIIAGDQFQGREYIKRKMAEHGNMFNHNDFVIVTSPNSLRGMSVEHGVFIGTWRNLPQLEEIFQLLIIHSRLNPVLRSIYESWKNESGIT